MTVLSSALEQKETSSELISKALRKLKLEQARRDLDEARLIATRRSGARGAKARQVLIEKEKAVEQAEQL